MNPIAITAVVLVLVVGLLSWLLFLIRTGSGVPISGVQELEGNIETVDLIAFRNLIDPNETESLRAQLPRKAFRRVQRLRTRAAMAYVQAVYRNAGVTIRLAEQLLCSPDQLVKEEAHQIQQLSVETRMKAISSLLRLQISLIAPTAALSTEEVAASYLKIAERIESLCFLTAPLYTSRIASAFK
jgi:hypothetical protein